MHSRDFAFLLSVTWGFAFSLGSAPGNATVYELPADGSAVIGADTTITTHYSDTLLDIARKYSLGYDEIIRANPGVDMWLPGEGTQIVLPGRRILPPGPRQGVIVNLPEHRLYYFPKGTQDGKRVVITFPVSVGRLGRTTPLGQTRVIAKVAHPSWYPPPSIRKEHAEEGDPLPVVVGPGPDNPLGDFKIRLGFGDGTYEIHGTNNPTAVGLAITHGCIRMYPEDVAVLFPLLPVGTSVRLINEPVKVAWIDGKLLLEAHPPVNARGESFEPDVNQFSDLLRLAVGETTLAIHWDYARELLKKADGVIGTVGLEADAPQPTAADLRIEHVTIVSPERVAAMRDALVRVHAGRIVAISRTSGAAARSPKDTTVIDGSGLFLAPGLIDSHVHLGEIPGMTPDQEAAHPDIARAAREQIPRSYLLYGFTTLVDLISTPQAMVRWKSHDIVPDTYFCGGAALMDGYSMNYAPKPQRYQGWPYMLIEPGTQAPEGIDPAMHTPQAVVSRMKADGAICVKTFFERGFGGVRDLPVPKLETIRELVKAAHAAGLPVLIHANSDEAQQFGLDAGVDIMAHGLWNWSQQHSATSELTPGIKKILDDEVARNIGWQPTMQVLYGIRDLFSTSVLADPRLSRVLPSDLIDWYRSPEGQWFRDDVSQGFKFPDKATPSDIERVVNAGFGTVIDRGKQATAYIVARGGRILFGSDTPSAPSYANAPGLNEWLEMHRLIDAGETAAQIFKSATLTNAQALKLDRDIGTVQVGKRADLLLLRQDPTQTIDAYDGIAKVILNGRVLAPSELAVRQH